MKHTHAFCLFVGMTALLAVAGCGGSSSTTPPPSRLPLSSSAVAPDGLTATLSQNTASVAAGGSIVYTLTLANHTAQPITYQEQAGCGSDGEGAYLQVIDAAGNPVYPDPNQGTCGAVAIISPLTLAPGQSSSATVHAPVTLPNAGRYFATASFAVGTVTDAGRPSTSVGPLEVDAQ